MELTRDNVSTAADPQAITITPPPKQPVSNNDPTRDITTRQSVDRMIAVVLCGGALVALAIASLWTVVGR